MNFADEDLTEDALLGGRVVLRQPRRGYRAATDPVLLAAAVTAWPGDRVLDVGCGVGAVALCLSARLQGLEAHGLETQPAYAALARRNGLENVWDGDLFSAPPQLTRMSFDWVVSNPPFFSSDGAASPDAGRDAARREVVPAGDWARACLRRVRSGGRLAIIHRAERLPELLAALDGVGDIAVLPLQARAGRPAGRIILTARKGARGPFRLSPPLILHAGQAHAGDGDDFTPEASRILRDGEALSF